MLSSPENMDDIEPPDVEVIPRGNGALALSEFRVQSSDTDDASLREGCEEGKILCCTFASRTRGCRELGSVTNYTKLAHLHVSHDGRVNSTQANPTCQFDAASPHNALRL